MRIFETKVVLSINLPVNFEKNNLLRCVMSGKKVPKYEQRLMLPETEFREEKNCKLHPFSFFAH